MSKEEYNERIKRVEALIGEFVQVNHSKASNDDLGFKLDVLERTIELIRYKNKRLKNELKYEEFLKCDVLCDAGELHFNDVGRKANFGSGVPQVEYQPKLLLYLLLRHKDKYRVIETIDGFIMQIWEYLDPIDFKKTETGVYRCYTNTRFAAKTLREYGLLKYTVKEAFKTWVLSFPGFLVAAVVMDKYKYHWKVPKFEPNLRLNLHQDIIDVRKEIDSYDEYVKVLAKICKPNVEIFKTFDVFLRVAYKLLGEYWSILEKSEKTISERQKASYAVVQTIENLPEIDEFYEELSKCINLNRILGDGEG